MGKTELARSWHSYCAQTDARRPFPTVCKRQLSRMRQTSELIAALDARCHRLAQEIRAVQARNQVLVQRAADSRRDLDRAVKELSEENERIQERALDAEDGMLEFWRSVASSSAAQSLDRKVDLHTKELLANGKYGFAFKCKRSTDGKEVVVKLLSIQWSHVAVKEWVVGAEMVGSHDNIVNYSRDVVLHADDDKSIDAFLLSGFEDGKLRGRQGFEMSKQHFGDRYIALMVEFMNRGTVQNWINEGILYPGGVLTVMRCVASALAYMHGRDLAHNDVKPENIFLAQEDTADVRSPVVVKLGDLGNADASSHFDRDCKQFVVTAAAMASYEPFDERAADAPSPPEVVQPFSSLDLEPGAERLRMALANVPAALEQVWNQNLSMSELSGKSWLDSWSFFDGEPRDVVDLVRAESDKAPAASIAVPLAAVQLSRVVSHQVHRLSEESVRVMADRACQREAMKVDPLGRCGLVHMPMPASLFRSSTV